MQITALQRLYLPMCSCIIWLKLQNPKVISLLLHKKETKNLTMCSIISLFCLKTDWIVYDQSCKLCFLLDESIKQVISSRLSMSCRRDTAVYFLVKTVKTCNHCHWLHKSIPSLPHLSQSAAVHWVLDLTHRCVHIVSSLWWALWTHSPAY